MDEYDENEMNVAKCGVTPIKCLCDTSKEK